MYHQEFKPPSTLIVYVPQVKDNIVYIVLDKPKDGYFKVIVEKFKAERANMSE
jgi:hypothetical protein